MIYKLRVDQACFYATRHFASLMLGNFVAFLLLSQVAIASESSEFLAARTAFERRDMPKLTAAHEKFSQRNDFILSPYVTAWWLSAQLAQSTQNAKTYSKEIEKFIATHPNAPFAEQLHRDYLRALARLELWPQFALSQLRYTGEDNEVACQRLRHRLQTDDRSARPAILADIKTIWSAAKSAAEPCYAAFALLPAADLLNNNDIWLRTRALLVNGQLGDARRTATLATNVSANFEALSAQANLDAKRFLDKNSIDASNRQSMELALFAVTRLARSSTTNAAEWLEKNEKKFKPEYAQFAWAQIGLVGAMQHDADALRWFRRAGTSALNDNQAAWLVRAALRDTATNAASWRTVKDAILSMSALEKRESAWRYWLARALSQSGDAADSNEARSIRESLARDNHFYGVLAAEELGQPPIPNFQGHRPTDADIAEVSKRAGIQRAFALYRLAETNVDFRNDALREWQFVIRGMDDQTLLAAAEAARRQDLPDRAINTAERTQSLHDFAQRYPLPHRAALQTSAKQNSLDEAWVFGLIRQESRFITDARSRVGAMGLMQLMPATATWVAKQIGIKEMPMTKVVDIPTNLALGSFYLRHVLDDLGHTVLATAAYNAGPGRARRWRADTALEGAIYAESIPFNETRDYVKKVMVNKWFYSHRIHGKSPKLSEIMGIVPSKNSARSNAKVAAATFPADSTSSISSTQQ